MKKLLSLPQNLIRYFHKIEAKDSKKWFCASDPLETPLGSGGGTSWLLKESWKEDNGGDFNQWLNQEKRILIHAGGQSRRLPGYAPSGKILTPIPVFRWERGQQIDQNLLDLQVPLYEKILEKAPEKLNTLIASGDVYIRSEGKIDELPDVDIACYGLWVNAELAKNHGVFVCDKANPEALDYMLQKPTIKQLQDLSQNKLYLMDIGVWVLSDRAVEVLVKHSGYSKDKDGKLIAESPLKFYDLYGDFGLKMGLKEGNDPEINDLSVAILPLPKGEFYHFGTSKELISSTLAIQNRVMDQRSILHKDSKPHSSMFVQNANVSTPLRAEQRNLWIENSAIGKDWKLDSDHIITGIPNNNWNIELPKGICLDVVPLDDTLFCIRPYGFNDSFRGEVSSNDKKWMDESVLNWMTERSLTLKELSIDENIDIQYAKLFPVVDKEELKEALVSWMIMPSNTGEIKSKYLGLERISATEISDRANLERLYSQRTKFGNENISTLHKNYKKSVFYQVDLDAVAKRVADNGILLPTDAIPEDPFLQMHEYMFQAKVLQYQKKEFQFEAGQAFKILQESIIKTLPASSLEPELNVFQDQIVWARSPVRIDVAGGWSDTPPYSLIHGGAVVNMAIELNGQPPLQVYVKPSKEFKVILKSIDIGTREDVSTYAELSKFNQVGSAFSIPKVALFLAGFHPQYSKNKFNSLEEQLKAFGSGIEISTLAAIPKGSGLGTSSILAATVLGALSDFCGFGWNQNEISHRTLVLEQLLTTGGGWQDQYGGVLPGIKLLHTQRGSNQIPEIKWAPEFTLSKPENKACMLLYYTGITRTAKDILSEIVGSMFLNQSKNSEILREIKQHAFDTFDVLQRGNFDDFSNCVAQTWNQKQKLDSGTNPPEVQNVISIFKDYAKAYKLPGAGGGGYIFIIAKDPEAAGKIRKLLIDNPPNNRARFVNMDISTTGLQVTRS